MARTKGVPCSATGCVVQWHMSEAKAGLAIAEQLTEGI